MEPRIAQVIAFDDVAFSYGDRVVLQAATLSFEPGSFNVICGPSGAGKTTFLRLCYRDLVPSRGEIRFSERRIGRRDRNGAADLRAGMGVVPQDGAFLDHLTVMENIALPLRIDGIDPKARKEDLDALLDWVDLTPLLEALPPALSRGERRRAALARAVIRSPDILLADGPASGLDPDAALQIWGLLADLNRMGKTILVTAQEVTTHGDAALADRLARLPLRIVTLDGMGGVSVGDAS
ncbi:MAG: ATP-binding cassette domain-containing protein [Pseudomonadota bacterium]